MSCFLLSLPLWGKALCGEAGCQMEASPFSACLSACLPAILGPGIVPVPGMGFKFVNNFPFGLVDVMGLGKSFHSLHLLPCLISSHSTLSQALVVYPFSLPILRDLCCSALMSHWLFSSGTLSFSLLSYTSLGFISLLCPVLSSVIPTLCQPLLPQALAKL
ncbi:hypothetical protein ACRRTK_000170 [Alexandromys fortis]